MRRKKYSKEFKVEACKLVLENNRSIASVTRELCLSEGILNKWVRLYKSDPQGAFPGEGTPQVFGNDSRVRLLEKELKQVKIERDILKKAMAYFVENPK